MTSNQTILCLSKPPMVKLITKTWSADEENGITRYQNLYFGLSIISNNPVIRAKPIQLPLTRLDKFFGTR